MRFQLGEPHALPKPTAIITISTIMKCSWRCQPDIGVLMTNISTWSFTYFVTNSWVVASNTIIFKSFCKHDLAERRPVPWNIQHQTDRTCCRIIERTKALYPKPTNMPVQRAVLKFCEHHSTYNSNYLIQKNKVITGSSQCQHQSNLFGTDTWDNW